MAASSIVGRVTGGAADVEGSYAQKRLLKELGNDVGHLGEHTRAEARR